MQKRGTGLDELYETLKQFNTKSKSILPAGNSKAVARSISGATTIWGGILPVWEKITQSTN